MSLESQRKIGDKLREARERNNLTQDEVAKAAKITTNYYAMTERGQANVSLDKLLRILKVLKIKSFDLVDYL